MDTGGRIRGTVEVAASTAVSETGAAGTGGNFGRWAGHPRAGSGLTISCQHFGHGPCNPAAAAGTVSTAPQAGQPNRTGAAEF